MIQNKAFKFKGAGQRLITADLSFRLYESSVPICVFVHGFKGFKDWGAWPLAAQIFALKGLPFFKFNFSHNGTSPEHLSEFHDLKAFGNNNLSMELHELGLVLDFIEKKSEQFEFKWNGEIYLIGHSRGGGMAVLRTVQDKRIHKCVCWAAVSDFGDFVNAQDSKEWLDEGVIYVENSRTNQSMPIYYQFYLDYISNKGKLDILENSEELEQDLLIIHGEEDKTVNIKHAEKLYAQVAHSIFIPIEGADHTFNTKHPLTEKKIPLAFAQVIDETIEFLQM